jgi:hypothetical protein
MAVEEVRREIAATGEVPPELPPHWFLYLVERMDRMENNLRAEFRDELGSVKQEIGRLDGKIDGVHRWSIGLMVTMLLGFGGLIATLAVNMNQ